MRNCIPDELFNLIPFPVTGFDAVGLGPVVQEIAYKIPVASDTLVRKEVWHSVCDFAYRTGALVDKVSGQSAESDVGEVLSLESQYGPFLRVVGAGNKDGATTDFKIGESPSEGGNITVEFPTQGGNYVIFSVSPDFSDKSVSSGAGGVQFWDPKVPSYFLKRYGECITHGALMRIFVMSGKQWSDPALAKMHAVAYNNDLNRLSFGLITSGMRKHLLIDVEDFILSANGNG